MSKPSILVVTGSFALPEAYDRVVDPVAAKGYEIRALHLPSVGLKTGTGREGPPPTMYDDAALVAKEVENLAEEGKDVVLVAHSYGGVPATESIRGLEREERRKKGKRGGIVEIAYMTALVPEIGMSAASVLADVPDAPEENQFRLEIDVGKGLDAQDPARIAPVVLSSLPQEEAEVCLKKWALHSAISFAGELTYAGYKDIPVSYLLCEGDLCISPKQQKKGIELIEKESGRKVNVTSIKADHCPMITAPQEVVDWILAVAGKA